MKPILTPDEAGALDRAAQEAGTPAAALMERAGRAVARAAVDLVGGVYGRRVVVVCGKGNNGGDGLVAARHLARWGMRVVVIVVEHLGTLREPAASNLARLSEVGVRARGWSSATLAHELARADVAIDAIFGTGFRGFPEDEWADAIDGLNAGPAPIVAVDIPSGVNGATGAVEGEAVRAEVTVTFGAAKVGAVLLPERSTRAPSASWTSGSPASSCVPARSSSSRRTSPGGSRRGRSRRTSERRVVLVVVAGSRGMTGAPSLVAEAAGRTGAGLVTVAAPAEIMPTIQSRLTEATFLPLPATGSGSVARDALAPVLELLGRADALAIGPGLTTDDETAAFVRQLVRASPVPMVVDADALNAFAGRAADLGDRKADAILTPHAGEFARLTGLGSGELDLDRLGHAGPSRTTPAPSRS